MRAIVFFIIALGIQGCAERRDIDELRAKIVSLEIENAAIRHELKVEGDARVALEGRIQIAEINLDTLFGQKSTDGQWILWELQVNGPIGGGFRKPIPRFAYADEAKCSETIAYNMKQLKGDPATGQWTDGTGYTFRASCLPKGVDPR